MEEYVDTNYFNQIEILSIYKYLSNVYSRMIVDVKPSTRKNKKYVAIFKNGKKIHFGQKGSNTYLDHKDVSKREAYRKRHLKDLNTNDPYKPGYLSYEILWGDKTNLKDAIKEYNNKYFNISN